ncbi:MAG: helicase, partial [Caldilineaceae bacterium SB0668_bin_21]|nr:helicase [Caldilineaceae bacterium SB0668_bin_21]
MRSERDVMRLLYRGRRVFAVGHGCAPEWNDTASETTDLIRTEVMPSFEIAPIYPTKLPTVDLNMERLAGDDQLSIRSGEDLAASYAAWIKELDCAVEAEDGIPTDLLPAARENIARAKRCLDRMRVGIQHLRENPDARLAFSLMNRAMMMQQRHYAISTTPRVWSQSGNALKLDRRYESPRYRDTDNAWRPFQFAFVLLNIVGMVDPSHADREIVDVIWFPTGGGKTEAYLGLSAFTILWRRLRQPQDSGTVVLMRYTLRLLTTQQYQRAASLICALEYLRRRDTNRLGNEPISIGLWVGGSVTPNRETYAKQALIEMASKGNSENRFVLVSCPWCGAGMGAYAFRRAYRVVGYRTLPSLGRVAHICD